MAPVKLRGEAVQIVNGNDNNCFELDKEALSKILTDSRVKNSKIMVLSVAGAYRRGKSFLLNFFLRYLQTLNDSDYTGTQENWLSESENALMGFKWKGGSERTTSGILMWSEPFIITRKSGERICVLLMDTQGSFDSESTVKECATVFALSTMISSVQIYNISGNIQEDDLQHLQLFTEYGRLALEEYSDKPFQTLHFLVRDWQYPYQHPFGWGGGGQLLEKRLEITDTQHSELQELRKHLKNCFNDIDCFLMPHPGLTVATSKNFKGKLEDIEENFLTEVQKFTEFLFNPENVVIKKINGQPITGQELIEYFNVYMEVYNTDELPEPKTMLEATAQANNLAAVANAKEFYSKEMEKICGGDRPFMRLEDLEKEHQELMKKSLEMFQATKKMGGAEFSKTYESKLELQLLEMYDQYEKSNKAKNVLGVIQTPLMLLFFSIGFYILSGIFSLIGLEILSDTCNIFMLICFILLFAWSYSRYTGNLTFISDNLDYYCKYIYQIAMKKSKDNIDLMGMANPDYQQLKSD